jgi:hypothetical protein
MADNESAGATPAVPDATSGQTTGAQPVPPATGEAELGEAGKRALEAERKAARDAMKRAEAAEKLLAELQTANQTDQERALAEARKAGESEATAKAHAMVRRSEVRRALSAAGIASDGLDLAAGAPDFAGLTVGEAGDVADLDAAVSAFRATHPTLFAGGRSAGSFDTGTGAGRAAARTFSRQQIKDPAFYAANRDAIHEAMTKGQITD